MPTLTIPTLYYQQFDADFTLDVPAEGYGGWKTAELEFDPAHTAVVVMHAWDCGTREEYPGWHRAVEYIARSYDICRTVFPPLLSAVRASPFKLMHVVSGDHPDLSSYPGYQRGVELAGPRPAPPEMITGDPTMEALHRFRSENVFVGKHNEDDVRRGFQKLDFPPEAKPQGDEGIAATGHELFALCKDAGINHLIYAGFAINWCLLLSPGGMAEMCRHGIMCSAFRQAVTAVENKESARQELAKELGLWRTALAFGFVFDVATFIEAIDAS